MDSIINKLSTHGLESIGRDIVRHYSIKIFFYYIFIVILAINTYKVIYDFSNWKKDKNSNRIFSKYDLYIGNFIGVLELGELYIAGMIADNYSGLYANHLTIVILISIALWLIQYFVYIKISPINFNE